MRSNSTGRSAAYNRPSLLPTPVSSSSRPSLLPTPVAGKGKIQKVFESNDNLSIKRPTSVQKLRPSSQFQSINKGLPEGGQNSRSSTPTSTRSGSASKTRPSIQQVFMKMHHAVSPPVPIDQREKFVVSRQVSTPSKMDAIVAFPSSVPIVALPNSPVRARTPVKSIGTPGRESKQIVCPYTFMLKELKKEKSLYVKDDTKDRDLKTIMNQLTLFRFQLMKKLSDDRKHEEGLLLNAWQLVYDAEEEAFGLKSKEKIAIEVNKIHGQLIDMDTRIDQVNNFLAPVFEKLNAYVNLRIVQVEEAKSAGSIRNITAKATSNREYSAGLLNLERGIRVLERILEKRDRLLNTSIKSEVQRINSFSDSAAVLQSPNGSSNNLTPNKRNTPGSLKKQNSMQRSNSKDDDHPHRGIQRVNSNGSIGGLGSPRHSQSFMNPTRSSEQKILASHSHDGDIPDDITVESDFRGNIKRVNSNGSIGGLSSPKLTHKGSFMNPTKSSEKRVLSTSGSEDTDLKVGNLKRVNSSGSLTGTPTPAKHSASFMNSTKSSGQRVETEADAASDSSKKIHRVNSNSGLNNATTPNKSSASSITSPKPAVSNGSVPVSSSKKLAAITLEVPGATTVEDIDLDDEDEEVVSVSQQAIPEVVKDVVKPNIRAISPAVAAPPTVPRSPGAIKQISRPGSTAPTESGSENGHKRTTSGTFDDFASKLASLENYNFAAPYQLPVKTPVKAAVAPTVKATEEEIPSAAPVVVVAAVTAIAEPEIEVIPVVEKTVTVAVEVVIKPLAATKTAAESFETVEAPSSASLALQNAMAAAKLSLSSSYAGSGSKSTPVKNVEIQVVSSPAAVVATPNITIGASTDSEATKSDNNVNVIDAVKESVSLAEVIDSTSLHMTSPQKEAAAGQEQQQQQSAYSAFLKKATPVKAAASAPVEDELEQLIASAVTNNGKLTSSDAIDSAVNQPSNESSSTSVQQISEKVAQQNDTVEEISVPVKTNETIIATQLPVVSGAYAEFLSKTKKVVVATEESPIVVESTAEKIVASEPVTDPTMLVDSITVAEKKELQPLAVVKSDSELEKSDQQATTLAVDDVLVVASLSTVPEVTEVERLDVNTITPVAVVTATTAESSSKESDKKEEIPVPAVKKNAYSDFLTKTNSQAVAPRPNVPGHNFAQLDTSFNNSDTSSTIDVPVKSILLSPKNRVSEVNNVSGTADNVPKPLDLSAVDTATNKPPLAVPAAGKTSAYSDFLNKKAQKETLPATNGIKKTNSIDSDDGSVVSVGSVKSTDSRPASWKLTKVTFLSDPEPEPVVVAVQQPAVVPAITPGASAYKDFLSKKKVSTPAVSYADTSEPVVNAEELNDKSQQPSINNKDVASKQPSVSNDVSQTVQTQQQTRPLSTKSAYADFLSKKTSTTTPIVSYTAEPATEPLIAEKLVIAEIASKPVESSLQLPSQQPAVAKSAYADFLSKKGGNKSVAAVSYVAETASEPVSPVVQVGAAPEEVKVEAASVVVTTSKPEIVTTSTPAIQQPQPVAKSAYADFLSKKSSVKTVSVVSYAAENTSSEPASPVVEAVIEKKAETPSVVVSETITQPISVAATTAPKSAYADFLSKKPLVKPVSDVPDVTTETITTSNITVQQTVQLEPEPVAVRPLSVSGNAYADFLSKGNKQPQVSEFAPVQQPLSVKDSSIKPAESNVTIVTKETQPVPVNHSVSSTNNAIVSEKVNIVETPILPAQKSAYSDFLNKNKKPIADVSAPVVAPTIIISPTSETKPVVDETDNSTLVAISSVTAASSDHNQISSDVSEKDMKSVESPAPVVAVTSSMSIEVPAVVESNGASPQSVVSMTPTKGAFTPSTEVSQQSPLQQQPNTTNVTVSTPMEKRPSISSQADDSESIDTDGGSSKGKRKSFSSFLTKKISSTFSTPGKKDGIAASATDDFTTDKTTAIANDNDAQDGEATQGDDGTSTPAKKKNALSALKKSIFGSSKKSKA